MALEIPPRLVSSNNAHLLMAVILLTDGVLLFVWAYRNHRWRLTTLPLLAGFFGTLGASLFAALFWASEHVWGGHSILALLGAHLLHCAGGFGVYIVFRLVRGHDTDLLSPRSFLVRWAIALSPYVMLAFYVPATLLVLWDPFPTQDLKADPSAWGFLYRALISAPPSFYYFSFALLYMLGSARARVRPFKLRYKYGGIAVFVLGLLYINMWLWPFVPLFWPYSDLAPYARVASLNLELPLALVVGFFTLRSLGVRFPRDPSEKHLRAFDAYSSRSEHMNFVVRDFLDGTRARDTFWYLRLHILEEAVRLCLMNERAITLASKAYAMLVLYQHNRLTRYQMLNLYARHAVVLEQAPPGSNRRQLAEDDQLPELIPLVVALTDTETDCDLSNQSPWCQLTALALATDGFLAPNQAISLLDKTRGRISTYVRVAYNAARNGADLLL